MVADRRKVLVQIDIERSRRSRSFENGERLWDEDLKRIIKMIQDHVKSLEVHFKSKRADKAWRDSAPNLSLAIFGPPGSGKSSLLKTLVAEAQKEKAPGENGGDYDLKMVASLNLLQPSRFEEGDHLLYATVAASLDAHRIKEGRRFDYEAITPVLQAYRDIANHLRVIHKEDFGNNLEPHALAAEVVQRHTSGLRLHGLLNGFFNRLASNLTGDDHSVVLLPVDDLDLAPNHLLHGLRQLQAYLLHPRLVPVFCFTDRLAEEILAGDFANVVSHADSQRRQVGRLGVSEQLAVQYLAKCFPIRNRIRLGPGHAVLQGGSINPDIENEKNGEPIILTLAAASVLLFGVQDRNARHPVVAALRPSTLRRQFHVLDGMRQVGVDALINEGVEYLTRRKRSENWKNPENEFTWGVLFDRAAWTLFNVHRDVLRENGMLLEDLYSWMPHALRRVLLDSLFGLPVQAQLGLWQRWRSLSDSRRSQVLSLLAANAYRPWLPGEQPSGEDHQQVLVKGNKDKSSLAKLEIPARLALLWFIDLAVSFYLPFSRSIFRHLARFPKSHKNTEKEPFSGAGWSLHSAPIHAALAADDDRKPFPTGMIFLDALSYSIALTTVPRIEACRLLDRFSNEGEGGEDLIKRAKVELLSTPTDAALNGDENLEKILERIFKKADPKLEKYSSFPHEIFKDYQKYAKWESGKEGTITGTKMSLATILKGEKIKDKRELIKKLLERHDYESVRKVADELNVNAHTLKMLIRGLEAAANAVHDDQLLLRIWTCYGYNRGRFWAAVSLWRGLGLMGQLIESYRRWKNEFLFSQEKNKPDGRDPKELPNKEEKTAFTVPLNEKTEKKESDPVKIERKRKEKRFLIQKISGVLHTHSLRGLVPGKDLAESSDKGTLELAFASWNTRGQRQAIRRLAVRLYSWLENSESLDLKPFQSSGEPLWSSCIVRRLHGSSMVGALWQWLDAEILEHQGRQYGQRKRYYWNAGVALTSWLRVLQSYFERTYEIRWLLESCPLTGPFLSRTKNDTFLSDLMDMPYCELLKVIQEDGEEQPSKEGDPETSPPIREAERFRAVTTRLQQKWKESIANQEIRNTQVESDAEEKDEVKEWIKKLAGPICEKNGLVKRWEWNEAVVRVFDNLLNLSENNGPQEWKWLFNDSNQYSRTVKIASRVLKNVQKQGKSSNSGRYLESLVQGFNPRVRDYDKKEDDDEIDFPSACFEIASLIQQYWKVSAHASAANLFYQLPRVSRDDFFGEESEKQAAPKGGESEGKKPKNAKSGSKINKLSSKKKDS